jgi:hypothetical protein
MLGAWDLPSAFENGTGCSSDEPARALPGARGVKPPDPALEALWKNVLSSWESDAAHHAFLDHCQRREALDEAAMRYRGMKGDRQRGPGAEKRLTAVLMLAMSKLEVSRNEPRSPPGSATKLLLILFFLVGSLVMLAYLVRT